MAEPRRACFLSVSGYYSRRDNLLTEIEEVKYGTPLQLLKQLDIAGNAIVDHYLSRFHIVHLMPQVPPRQSGFVLVALFLLILSVARFSPELRITRSIATTSDFGIAFVKVERDMFDLFYV
eukprot:scaffold290247_cov17-Prasinocladus_malaysianus.AAC.1